MHHQGGYSWRDASCRDPAALELGGVDGGTSCITPSTSATSSKQAGQDYSERDCRHFKVYLVTVFDGCCCSSMVADGSRFTISEWVRSWACVIQNQNPCGMSGAIPTTDSAMCPGAPGSVMIPFTFPSASNCPPSSMWKSSRRRPPSITILPP